MALPIGGGEKVIDGYRNNAEWVFEVSRGLAAVLCLAGVAAVYYAGRRLWDRRTGLVAAAILCFAFLPVAFSRIAVTDVGTLAPVALALLFAIRMHETGGSSGAPRRAWRPGWRSASSTPPGWSCSPRRSRWRCRSPRSANRAALRAAALGGLALGGGALLAFFVTNPYFFLDLDTALHQLRGQAELAGNQDKFGQEQRDRRPLLPRQPDLGARLGARPPRRPPARCCWRAATASRLALLLVFPVALFVYLSLQSRFFGRWLLPVYPALALLAGYAVVRGDRGRARAGAAAGVAGGRRRRRAAAVAAARRRRALDGRARPPRHARDRARLARRERAARAADHHRAGGARALLLAGPRRPPAEAARARSSSTSSSATSARRTSSTAARCGPSVLDRYRAPGLLHGDDDGPDPRARRGGRRPRRARLLRAAGAASPTSSSRSARTAPTRSRSRSASTSPTATTRPPTSGPGPRSGSTGCATACSATARGSAA